MADGAVLWNSVMHSLPNSPSSWRKHTLYAWLESSWPLGKLKDWKYPEVPVWYCRQSAGALGKVGGHVGKKGG